MSKGLSSKLREARGAVGYTQAELGAEVGVSERQVRRYEAGENVPPTRAVKISTIVREPLSTLFGGSASALAILESEHGRLTGRLVAICSEREGPLGGTSQG